MLARIAALLLLSACGPATPDDVLDEVWSLVRTHFFDPALNGVDWDAARRRARAQAGEAALDAAIDGMLAELGASHTKRFTRDDVAYHVLLELFWDALEPEQRARVGGTGPPPLPGIGILTEEAEVGGERGSFVCTLLAGSPAEAAGLRVGDRLIAVEGEPFRPVASFRERVGRWVPLSVQRSADPASVEVVQVRPEAVTARAQFLRALRSSGKVLRRESKALAYVQMVSYAGEELHEALRGKLLHGPLAESDGLVLDLRGGFGGANPEYLELFRRDLPALVFRARDGEERAPVASWTKPVVLLVDEGTTSGKEIFAHGFRRLGLGKIVGTRSAGAVLGARLFVLSDGSVLYLAVQDVHVDGERLEGRGVEPDVLVPWSRPFSGGADPQLEAALATLARL
ncbi:MAG TPA: S41 family peptidase [Planctomycetota bacterium]